MPSTTKPPAEPRVVMFVANAFVHDTRVYKQARSLIEWGCEVHVIALARPDLPAQEVQDGIHIHRLQLQQPSLRALFMVPLTLKVRSRGGLRRLLRWDQPQPATAAPTAAKPNAAPALSQLQQDHSSRAGPPKRILARARSFLRRVIRRTLSGPRLGFRRVARAVRSIRAKITPQATRLVRLNIRMYEQAAELKPDVVQSHDLNTLLAGWFAKRLLNVPLVYDSHELYLERNIGDRSRLKDKLMWGSIERACIGRCDAVMSVAEGICRHLQKQYSIGKPHLIRNVQPYEPPAPRSHILADELGVDRSTRLVVYPGAITINRGLEAMIDSAKHLDDAAYIIMGFCHNPEYLACLKQRADDGGVLGTRVFFRDAVPINDVLRYVASTDLGIVPTQNVCLSYFYESSNKMFHCLMAGVPLVMSDHAEKRLLAEQYGVGVLFDETEPRDIARAVNELLADDDRYQRMRSNCLEAAKVLNWQHEEHKLRTMFASLLGDRAPAVPPATINEQDQCGDELSSHSTVSSPNVKRRPLHTS